MTTTFHSLWPISIWLCALESLQDTDLSLSTIAPHQSSSYPDYLSLTWDEDTQIAVVWTRLHEHHKLANHSLAKINKHFTALCQEVQQTQAESSHEPLSCDIKSNLMVASIAEKVFKKGLPLNQRGVTRQWLVAGLDSSLLEFLA